MSNVETSGIGLLEVRKYWENASICPLDEASLRPTARDPHLQELVETAIEKWIWRSAQVLDIGCGDGASTVLFANRAEFVHGVDFIPQYVKMARERVRRQNLNNVEFECGDVMDLQSVRARIGQPDIVVTIRCLVNLASWKNQAIALREIAATLKPEAFIC